MNHGRKPAKGETETIAESLQYFFECLMNALLTLYMLLILAVLPFYFTNGYAQIGTDKSSFFTRVSTGLGKLLLPVLLCCLAARGAVYVQGRRKGASKKPLRREVLGIADLFAGLYGVSLLLSYFCSDYKAEAFWGAKGWYMGLFAQLTVLAVYFLISFFWNRKDFLLFLAVPVSGIVFLLGYLNRFGIFPIDMKVNNVQFISTIGNINWYCGYLVTVLFGGVFWLWQGKARKEGLWIIYIGIGFATLVTQGSSSGLVTLFVMLLVFFCLSAGEAERMRQFWKLMLLLSGACLGTMGIRLTFPERLTYGETSGDILTFSPLPIIMTILSVAMYLLVRHLIQRGRYPKRCFQALAALAAAGSACAVLAFVVCLAVNTRKPGALGALSDLGIFRFSPEWGSNRGATWQAGIMCFAQQNPLHKLFGVGPDCMSAFLYEKGSPELLSLVKERFGSAVLTNAHNEWLTILVNTGILGFVSYGGMMISGIVRYIRRRKASPIAGAAGFCLLAYTVNNMFSFQQAMSISTVFVIFGVGAACDRALSRKNRE